MLVGPQFRRTELGISIGDADAAALAVGGDTSVAGTVTAALTTPEFAAASSDSTAVTVGDDSSDDSSDDSIPISIAVAGGDAAAVGGAVNVADTTTATVAAPGVASSTSASTAVSVGRRLLF